MNRIQIALKTGLDILGIPIRVENYKQICEAVYVAEQVGVHINPSRIEWDKVRKMAYSPKTEERCFSHNLFDDVREIQEELEKGLNDSSGYTLDNASEEKLRKLYQKPLRVS